MKPYIKICCPVYDLNIWHYSLAKACCDVLKSPAGFDYETQIARSTIIEEGRNVLITGDKDCQAIKQKLDPRFTHWLFIDHDCGFTEENINQLLAHKKDIVSGSYRPKDNPTRFVAGYCNDDGKIMNYATAVDTGLVPIDWVGGGFVLCTREALEKMDYPYWWKATKRYGNRALTIGEDVFFCLNARANLVSIYLDTHCILNHESNRYVSILHGQAVAA